MKVHTSGYLSLWLQGPPRPYRQLDHFLKCLVYTVRIMRQLIPVSQDGEESSAGQLLRRPLLMPSKPPPPTQRVVTQGVGETSKVGDPLCRQESADK